MSEKITEYKAKDFMRLIDKKFEENVGEIKRTDIAWGTWSREMNLEIRKRIEAMDPETFELGMVFSYWIIVSQLLDLIYECNGWKRIFMEKKLRAKTEEAIDLRKRIYEL